jgi:hypothetical protein
MMEKGEPIPFPKLKISKAPIPQAIISQAIPALTFSMATAVQIFLQGEAAMICSMSVVIPLLIL